MKLFRVTLVQNIGNMIKKTMLCYFSRFSRTSRIVNKTSCDFEHRQEISGLQGRAAVVVYFFILKANLKADVKDENKM